MKSSGVERGGGKKKNTTGPSPDGGGVFVCVEICNLAIKDIDTSQRNFSLSLSRPPRPILRAPHQPPEVFFVCAITVVAKKKAEEDETKLSHYHAFRLSETTSLITLRSRVSLARWRRRRPDTVTTFNKCFLLHSYHAMVGSQRIPLERMEKKCISARVRSNADLTSEHDRTNDQKGTFRFRLVTIEA